MSLRNSATAQQQKRHYTSAPLRNSATAKKSHRATAPPRFKGSVNLTFSLSPPPSPFCKAQQQRNRSLILDPHLRSSIHRALRNSATAQQRHYAKQGTFTLTSSLSSPPSPFRKAKQQRNRSLILDPRLRSSIHRALRNSVTAQQRHSLQAPAQQRHA